MSVLNHLAQAAAVLLLLELWVVLLIFLAISGGLAFGLRWVNGKTDWAFGKANGLLDTGRRYLNRGLDYAAQPVIVAGAAAGRVDAIAQSIRRQVRAARYLHASQGVQPLVAEPMVAAEPLAPEAAAASDATIEVTVVGADGVAAHPAGQP